jgi:hypothetical protein
MKYILSILFLFFFVSAFSQVYQEMPQYGYRANRFAFDSTLQIPTTCGVPTIKSVVSVNKKSALAFDSCNNKLYYYNPSTLTWQNVTGASGFDSTSLSNRINLKIDSLKKSNDSVYAYKNGTRYFQYKDSIGGGTTIDTTSLSNRINTKFAIADTGNKWVNSVTKVNDTTIRVIKNTTTTDFVITGRVIDTTSLSSRINNKLAIADTSNKWVNSVTKLNDSTIRVIKNTTTSDLLIRGNPQQATGSNGLSGTSIIKLGGNLDNGITAIESTTDGLSSITIGSTRKLDAFAIRNNQTTINSGSDIFLVQPTSGTDTTTYKPLGVASNGKIAKINNWFAGTTGTTIDTTSLSNRINDKLAIIDTTNKWVNSVTQPNDSTIRVIKNNTTSDLIIRASVAGSATRLITNVYNNSGATITKGSVVYINGAHSSNLPTIALAKANAESTSAYTYGLVENDISNNSAGIVIQSGTITNLNLPTSSYTDGQTLYLSPTTAGGYTLTKPLAPNHYVAIGTITRAHPNFGTIQIAIRNGFQLDEMSDVQIPLVPNDSTLLQFSRVDSLWHAVGITNAIGNNYVRDTSNKFVNAVTKINDSTIRVFKGSTSTDLLIRGNATGGGATPTLQEVLDYNHDLTNGNVYIGTNSGNGNTKNYVVAIGTNNLQYNTGISAVGIGVSNLQYNTADDVVAIGNSNAHSNISTEIVAIGTGTLISNTGQFANGIGYNVLVNNNGQSVNAIGSTCANFQSGNNLNAFGTETALSNTGNNVNALGASAANGNTGYNINALGLQAAYNNTGNIINAMGNNAAIYNTGNNVNAIGDASATSNTGLNVNAFGNSTGIGNEYNDVNLFGYGANATSNNQIVFTSSNGAYQTRLQQNNTQDNLINIPDSNGTLVLSVNGSYPDLKGNINTFKTYSASISASGGSTPTLNDVFINQLGSVTFSVSSSEYIIQCTGCFPVDKTYVAKPSLKGGTNANAYVHDVDTIYIELFDSSGTQVTTGFGNMLIEIKVYN